MPNKKIYSKYDKIPLRQASDIIVPGCIALEGGSFRGVYTSGVLDVLAENDINMQTTIGISAGALTGYNYATGCIGRAAKINLGYRHDSRYIGYKTFFRDKGLIGYKFLFNESVEMFPYSEESLESGKRRYIAVATSCLDGSTKYYEYGKCSNIFDAIQASSSMPYYSRIVKVDGTPCLDGGCSVKVPYQWAIDEGFEKIIVVRTLPKDYMRPEDGNNDAFAKVFYRRYPEFVKVLRASAPRANAETEELKKLEKKGRIFLICPPADKKMHGMEGDMEELGSYYEQGRKDAKAALSALKEYLGI